MTNTLRISLHVVQEDSLVPVSLQSTMVDPLSTTAPASSRKLTHSSSLANPSSVLMKDTGSVGRNLDGPRWKEGGDYTTHIGHANTKLYTGTSVLPQLSPCYAVHCHIQTLQQYTATFKPCKLHHSCLYVSTATAITLRWTHATAKLHHAAVHQHCYSCILPQHATTHS